MAEIVAMSLPNDLLMVVQCVTFPARMAIRDSAGHWRPAHEFPTTLMPNVSPIGEITSLQYDGDGAPYIFGTASDFQPPINVYTIMLPALAADTATVPGPWMQIAPAPSTQIFDLSATFLPDPPTALLLATNGHDRSLVRQALTPLQLAQPVSEPWKPYATPPNGVIPNGPRSVLLPSGVTQIWAVGAGGGVYCRLHSPGESVDDGSWISVPSSGADTNTFARMGVACGWPTSTAWPPGIGIPPTHPGVYPVYLFANDFSGALWTANAPVTPTDATPPPVAWRSFPTPRGHDGKPALCRHLTVVDFAGSVHVFGWFVDAEGSNGDVWGLAINTPVGTPFPTFGPWTPLHMGG